IRTAIQMVRKSTVLRESFKEACLLKRVKHKTLTLDAPHRWNSTFYMLQRVSEMREPLDCLIRNQSKLASFQVAEEEWNLISEMILLLKPFQDMTIQISKAKSPSMALSAAVYIELYNHLETFSVDNCSSSEIVTAAAAACEKLNKYYASSDGLVYVMGLLLDPRCKLDWYKSVGISADVIKANKKVALENWDRFYKSEDVAIPDNNDASDILSTQMKRSKQSKMDEFRKYLSLPVVVSLKDNSPLIWWKEQECNFPAVATMARDFLSVSGTGVPIERTFSLATDLLGPKQMLTSAETIKRRLSLKSQHWVYRVCPTSSLQYGMVSIAFFDVSN
ncbi:unnamed protein product, partial [Allacma fusca]